MFCGVRLGHETPASMKRSYSKTDAYVRFSGILNNTHEVFFFFFRLGHETNAKYETCSYSNTDAHVRFSGILNDTHQMFCGVRLGHEIVAKYETCSYSNTYAHVWF